jgi:hypothetical protein
MTMTGREERDMKAAGILLLKELEDVRELIINAALASRPTAAAMKEVQLKLLHLQHGVLDMSDDVNVITDKLLAKKEA